MCISSVVATSSMYSCTNCPRYYVLDSTSAFIQYTHTALLTSPPRSFGMGTLLQGAMRATATVDAHCSLGDGRTRFSMTGSHSDRCSRCHACICTCHTHLKILIDDSSLSNLRGRGSRHTLRFRRVNGAGRSLTPPHCVAGGDAIKRRRCTGDILAAGSDLDVREWGKALRVTVTANRWGAHKLTDSLFLRVAPRSCEPERRCFNHV